ncbi:MAG: ribonuclease III [Pararhodobacter sp.]|nr:ribonuclease III [Pararhodobacter sp.]
MKLSAELMAFATRLGHQFNRPELLARALTHSSIASKTRPDNQRLEFLGDRVLGLVMAEALFTADRSATEGQLAPRYNALVRKETCADIARAMGLGDVLRLGRSEMLTGGRRKETLLGDAMEAVIAAVYLDGGLDAARSVILQHWADYLASAELDARDPKTALQEFVQSRGEAPPVYSEIKREGPPHAPFFTIEARLADGMACSATAGSKRHAEQAAARALLEQLEVKR